MVRETQYPVDLPQALQWIREHPPGLMRGTGRVPHQPMLRAWRKRRKTWKLR